MVKIFQRLFSVLKPKDKDETNEVDEIKDVPTIPLSKEEAEGLAEMFESQAVELELPQLLAACSQSIGRQRSHNEDALFTLTTNLASDKDFMPLGLYIVADGMGGHKHGEIASGLAVRTIVGHLMKKFFVALLAPIPSAPEESIQEIMQESILEAHKAILKEAPGSGTTLTAVLMWNEQMTIAHVGDSRVYTIAPDGEIKTLTRDHSLVMRMMELGQLSAEEASVHPQRNVLYRALGQGEPFTPDITTSPLPETGYIMLCSDGLWGVVPDEKLSYLATNNPSPQIACELMIDTANAAGGPDNISAILVRLPDRTT
ncbi:MAG: serine/threonine-protein phosphatase [Anaerolineales bacterium]|nr:serine/threonine-protein phosphatase [Anaerolineales bacterium]